MSLSVFYWFPIVLFIHKCIKLSTCCPTTFYLNIVYNLIIIDNNVFAKMWPLILSCRNYTTLKFTWETCFQYNLLDWIFRPILNDCISNLCIIEFTLVRNIGIDYMWKIKL